MQREDAGKGVVIVGSGQAGYQLAVSLREEGWRAPITLLGEEEHPPYQRPPLSKAYLFGTQGPEALLLSGPGDYLDRDINLLRSCCVKHIDRASRLVSTDDGRAFPYSRLILATGARNRSLAGTSDKFSNQFSLRSLGDVEALRAEMADAHRIVVIGGGFLGLEFAAAAANGRKITVIEGASTLLSRGLRRQMAEALYAIHCGAGIDIRLSSRLDGVIASDGRVTSVRLQDGSVLDCDLLVVSIGVAPNDDLAREAQLDCDDGILVDDQLRTSDPSIYAIGDCARFRSPDGQGTLRLESVQNAVDQAKHVARHLARNIEEPYRRVPWFWSEQGSARIHIAGLTGPSDEILVRQAPAGGKISALCFREGLFVGVEAINAFADYRAGRTILEKDGRLDIEIARRPDFDLKSFAAAL